MSNKYSEKGNLGITLNDYWDRVNEETDNLKNNGLFDRLPFPTIQPIEPVEIIIQNINKYSEESLSNIVSNSWKELLDIIINPFDDNRDAAINVFTNPRWINAFNNYIFSLKDLRYISCYRKVINCLYYNRLIVLEESNEDATSEINSIYKLVSTINKNQVMMIGNDAFTQNIPQNNIFRLIMSRDYNHIDNNYATQIVKSTSMLLKEIEKLRLNVNEIITIFNVLYDSMTELLEGILHLNLRYANLDFNYYEDVILDTLFTYLNMQEGNVILTSLRNYTNNIKILFEDQPNNILQSKVMKYNRVYYGITVLYNQGITVPMLVV